MQIFFHRGSFDSGKADGQAHFTRIQTFLETKTRGCLIIQDQLRVSVLTLLAIFLLKKTTIIKWIAHSPIVR